MKKAIITQSNYIPWKGYFDSIAAVDVFVVYDDMQYTKRDWRNRNLIKTPQGLKWMSIPVEVKGKYFQKINETKISEKGWQKSHLGMLKQNYSKAKCFKDVFPWVEELYLSCNYDYLTEINLHFIKAINKYLGITTEIKFSSEFDLHEEKTQRLVIICKGLGVTHYYSGPAAKAYMEIDRFTKENIQVCYSDYSGYPEYDQLYPPFEHGVTIFDLIFSEGPQAKNYLKFVK
jgi:hypothetical protein